MTTKDVGTSVDEELGRNSLGCLPLVQVRENFIITGLVIIPISVNISLSQLIFVVYSSCSNESFFVLFFQENFALISDYLKFILPDPWTISILKESIIISEIMKPENPVIKKAISWSVEGMKILVVGMPLAPSHLLWQLRKPDIFNCGSVADYLTRVANSFALLNVCTGVLQYEELWEKCSEGVVQKSFDVPCLRHSSCFLLLGGQDICKPCNNLRKKLYDRVLKASSSAASDGAIPSTTNIKYLDKEELVQKIGKLQKEKKYYKERVKRLEERIAKLIKEKSERIDSELSADFVDIMNKNADKMTPFQKMFWQQQSLALSKSSAKGIRWHPAMIRLALHLRMLSPTAYDFLRGIISLPSQRRLFDYSQSTDVKEGVQQELLDEFSKTIEKECPEDHQKNFYLLLDEMSIRSDLVYNSRTGDLVGFTNLSSVENVLKELEDEMKGMKQTEKKLAKKVLVFMLTGATSDIRFVPAVFSTDDLSAAQLFSRTWDVVYSVEETGAKVIAVILDGASVNRKFLTMNFNFGNTKFVHVTMNVASGDCRPLYFMVDPPHLIKTFRNCLANSFSHRGSRTLWKNGQQLSWKAIEALYEITKNDKFKTTKLTKAHTKLSSFSCMKVILAVQVLSKSVAEALLRNKDNPLLKDAFSQELVDFILIMNRTFDCLNGGVHSTKKNINSDLNEYFSLDDPRFQFLEETVLKYLQDWENDVSRRKGFTKEQRSKMMISFQSMEALKITIHSFVHVSKFLLSNGTPSVSSRRMNQDPLEQYFSILRRCGGSNENPNLKGVLHTRQSLHNQGPTFLAGGSRGNTEVFKRQLEVDETPLPSRKRSKQE